MADEPSPAFVDIQRENVIEQVVAAGDARKHLADGFSVRGFVCAGFGLH